MVVGDVALKRDNDGVGRAVAMKGATRKVGIALGDAVINERVERWCHNDRRS